MTDVQRADAGQPDALMTVTGYAVSVLPADHREFHDYALYVDLTRRGRWVVHDGGAGFDADGCPRVREQDRHPFPSLDDALALARRLAPGMTIGSRTATDVLRDTVAALTPRQDAAVRPLEAPAGGDAGMESPEGVTGTQAGAQRLARMTVDTATDDGLDALYAELDTARTENTHLRAERDRARRVAVALEQQLAAVAALHTQWVAAGPPPLGTSMARWWDARLVEHHAALNPQEDQ